MNSNLSESLSNLKSNIETGLNSNQILEKTKQYGKNKLEEKKKLPFFLRFLYQFKNPMIILLLIATIISLIIAFVPSFSTSHGETSKIESVVEKVEPFVILFIVFLNTFFGAFQEAKSEKAVDSLNKMIISKAKVYRDGAFDVINSEDIVPGDILLLEAGDSIPADGIIIESSSFKTQESALTGEAAAIEKDQNFVFDEKTPIGDRKNCVYSGTNVLNGKAKILVTKTGMNTEIGKIAKLIANADDEKSSLEKKIGKLSNILGIVAFILIIIVFLIFTLYVNNPNDIAASWPNALKIGISVAIAAIPEGLFAIMTVVFALGIKRMIKHNALIKKIQTVEILGNVSVICSDKTGTLTQNKMTVVEIYDGSKSYSDFNTIKNKDIIEYGMLCNDSNDDDGVLVGDPTETSLVYAGINVGFNYEDIQNKYPRVADIPFDSDRKMMTTVHKFKNEYLVITKGAFDSICKVSNKIPKEFVDHNDTMSNKALRVLAIATKKIKKIPTKLSELEKNLDFCALFGIIDPPREEVKKSIELVKKAGITPIMITGDFANTAKAIAKELGIWTEDKLVISGQELSEMSDDELFNNVDKYVVYARVSPEDKIRIVRAWKKHNKIVAMTGDGVNDAPALKAADVGCAMGTTGTEVSKQASDMVLTDDNFSTIVEAVKEGRGVIDNLKRIILLMFTTNITGLLTVFLGMLIFHYSPFTALQILWINLVTESLPSIALGMKEPSEYLMEFKPKNKNSLIDIKMLTKILVQGFCFSSIALGMYYLGAAPFANFDFSIMTDVLKSNVSSSTSEINELRFNMQMSGSLAAFLVVTVSQSFNGFNLMSNKSMFLEPWKNSKYMLLAFSASLLLVLFVILLPGLNEVFNSNIYVFNPVIIDSSPIVDYYGNSVGNYGWIFFVAFIVSFLPSILVEIAKIIFNSKIYKNFEKKNIWLQKWNSI